MSRERDGGREPRQGPASRLISDKEQAGKLSDPLRFGPEREAGPDVPKQRRPDWKKASARKVREATAPVEPERREAIPPEQGQPVPEAVPETVETAGQTAEEYSAAVAAEVAQMVSAITGEANPHVTVTLRSMGETVYATEDRQSERNSQEYAGDSLNKAQTDGDTETTYIIVKDADGAQRPLVVTQTQPEIRGVVIVSRRGGDAQIRERITEAVKTALDLSSTQVCVTGYAEYT